MEEGAANFQEVQPDYHIYVDSTHFEKQNRGCYHFVPNLDNLWYK